MITLTYDLLECVIRIDNETLSSNIKPPFSFEYDTLNYTSITNTTSSYQRDNVDYELSAEESAEIATYIEGVEESEEETARFRASVFLRQTDWYITRLMETGQAVPVEILADRAIARADADSGE